MIWCILYLAFGLVLASAVLYLDWWNGVDIDVDFLLDGLLAIVGWMFFSLRWFFTVGWDMYSAKWQRFKSIVIIKGRKQ